MRLGSVTKAFSGAVALRLVQQGKLGLDDTIAERAPGLPAAWGGVTMRQLLNHTSGLPNFTTSQGFVDDRARRAACDVVPVGGGAAAAVRARLRRRAGEEAGGPEHGREPELGVGLRRYQTRCGTVYGHTGDFFGYAQFAAATADGKRALTTSLNFSAPHGALLRRLRTVQTTAVCALLAP
jgi:hypothetical protein